MYWVDGSIGPKARSFWVLVVVRPERLLAEQRLVLVFVFSFLFSFVMWGG